MHRDGRGVPQDLATARSFLAMGAEQVSSLHSSVWRVFKFVRVRVRQALRRLPTDLLRFFSQGLAVAELELGELLLSSGDPSERAKALDLCRAAAEKGDAVAMLRLFDELYTHVDPHAPDEEPSGVDESLCAEGVRWLANAVAEELPSAMTALAKLCENLNRSGGAVVVDEDDDDDKGGASPHRPRVIAQPLPYYLEAVSGPTVVARRQKAVELLKVAAHPPTNDDADAQAVLGSHALERAARLRQLARRRQRDTGDDGEVAADRDREYNEARQWLSRAAEKGHAEALCRLGRMEQQGQGGGKDSKLSVALYSDAAIGGSEEAVWRLEQLRRFGSKGQSPPPSDSEDEGEDEVARDGVGNGVMTEQWVTRRRAAAAAAEALSRLDPSEVRRVVEKNEATEAATSEGAAVALPVAGDATGDAESLISPPSTRNQARSMSRQRRMSNSEIMLEALKAKMFGAAEAATPGGQEPSGPAFATPHGTPAPQDSRNSSSVRSSSARDGSRDASVPGSMSRGRRSLSRDPGSATPRDSSAEAGGFKPRDKRSASRGSAERTKQVEELSKSLLLLNADDGTEGSVTSSIDGSAQAEEARLVPAEKFEKKERRRKSAAVHSDAFDAILMLQNALAGLGDASEVSSKGSGSDEEVHEEEFREEEDHEDVHEDVHEEPRIVWGDAKCSSSVPITAPSRPRLKGGASLKAAVASSQAQQESVAREDRVREGTPVGAATGKLEKRGKAPRAKSPAPPPPAPPPDTAPDKAAQDEADQFTRLMAATAAMQAAGAPAFESPPPSPPGSPLGSPRQTTPEPLPVPRVDARPLASPLIAAEVTSSETITSLCKDEAGPLYPYAKQLSLGIPFSHVEAKMVSHKLPGRFVERLKKALGRESATRRASADILGPDAATAEGETIAELCASMGPLAAYAKMLSCGLAWRKVEEKMMSQMAGAGAVSRLRCAWEIENAIIKDVDEVAPTVAATVAGIGATAPGLLTPVTPEDFAFAALSLSERVSHLELLPSSAHAAGTPGVRDQTACLLALPATDRAACLLRLSTQSAATVLVECKLRGHFGDTLAAMGRGGAAAVEAVLNSGGGKKKKDQDVFRAHKKLPTDIGAQVVRCQSAADAGGLLQGLPLPLGAALLHEMSRRGSAGPVLDQLAASKPSAAAALITEAEAPDRPALLLAMNAAARAEVARRLSRDLVAAALAGMSPYDHTSFGVAGSEAVLPAFDEKKSPRKTSGIARLFSGGDVTSGVKAKALSLSQQAVAPFYSSATDGDVDAELAELTGLLQSGKLLNAAQSQRARELTSRITFSTSGDDLAAAQRTATQESELKALLGKCDAMTSAEVQRVHELMTRQQGKHAAPEYEGANGSTAPTSISDSTPPAAALRPPPPTPPLPPPVPARTQGGSSDFPSPVPSRPQIDSPPIPARPKDTFTTGSLPPPVPARPRNETSCTGPPLVPSCVSAKAAESEAQKAQEKELARAAAAEAAAAKKVQEEELARVAAAEAAAAEKTREEELARVAAAEAAASQKAQEEELVRVAAAEIEAQKAQEEELVCVASAEAAAAQKTQEEELARVAAEQAAIKQKELDDAEALAAEAASAAEARAKAEEAKALRANAAFEWRAAAAAEKEAADARATEEAATAAEAAAAAERSAAAEAAAEERLTFLDASSRESLLAAMAPFAQAGGGAVVGFKLVSMDLQALGAANDLTAFAANVSALARAVEALPKEIPAAAAEARSRAAKSPALGWSSEAEPFACAALAAVPRFLVKMDAVAFVNGGYAAAVIAAAATARTALVPLVAAASFWSKGSMSVATVARRLLTSAPGAPSVPALVKEAQRAGELSEVVAAALAEEASGGEATFRAAVCQLGDTLAPLLKGQLAPVGECRAALKTLEAKVRKLDWEVVRLKKEIAAAEAVAAAEPSLLAAALPGSLAAHSEALAVFLVQAKLELKKETDAYDALAAAAATAAEAVTGEVPPADGAECDIAVGLATFVGLLSDALAAALPSLPSPKAMPVRRAATLGNPAEREEKIARAKARAEAAKAGRADGRASPSSQGATEAPSLASTAAALDVADRAAKIMRAKARADAAKVARAAAAGGTEGGAEAPVEASAPTVSRPVAARRRPGRGSSADDVSGVVPAGE